MEGLWGRVKVWTALVGKEPRRAHMAPRDEIRAWMEPSSREASAESCLSRKWTPRCVEPQQALAAGLVQTRTHLCFLSLSEDGFKDVASVLETNLNKQILIKKRM